MPHGPLKYKSEFKLKQKSQSPLNDYFLYWKFTNRKLEKLLPEIMIGNKYRIILTGDHGFRGDEKVNPRHTFMAFFGFSEQDLKTIKSVQDLGSLIYGCYQ